MELQTIVEVNLESTEKEKLKEVAQILNKIAEIMYKNDYFDIKIEVSDFELPEIQACKRFLKVLSDNQSLTPVDD